jgi:putative ABC transport system ATP-binding protein
MGILQELNDQGKTIVLVTHDAELARVARRLIRIVDGRITEDSKVTNRRDARAALREAVPA